MEPALRPTVELASQVCPIEVEFCRPIGLLRTHPVVDGPSNYGNNERCTFHVARDVVLTTVEFSTESNFDYLTINGVRYQGTSGPNGVEVGPSSIITWRTDGSVLLGGFTVCAASTNNVAPSPPPAENAENAVFQVTASSPAGACVTSSGGTCVSGETSQLWNP